MFETTLKREKFKLNPIIDGFKRGEVTNPINYMLIGWKMALKLSVKCWKTVSKVVKNCLKTGFKLKMLLAGGAK